MFLLRNVDVLDPKPDVTLELPGSPLKDLELPLHDRVIRMRVILRNF